MKMNRALTVSLGLAFAAVVGCGVRDEPQVPVRRISDRASLARSVLYHPNVQLANYHVSGMRDRATALDNIQQTAAGLPAARSSYGTAPGGQVELSPRMLYAMKVMADRGYKYHVTSIAGSSHSGRSRHYLGVAFDVNTINGVPVRSGSAYWRDFIRQCEAMGATETLGPGDPGHSTHIHLGWPRPEGM